MLKKDGLYSNIPIEWKTKAIIDSLSVTVLDDNIQKLVALIKKYGYPGQHRVGIKDFVYDGCCDSSIFIDFCGVANRIFYHHGCGFFLLEKELKDALYQGELHPREYATIYTFSFNWFDPNRKYVGYKNVFAPLYKTVCKPTKATKLYDVIHLDPVKSVDTVFVNACREEIGMATIQHDLAKKEFARLNNLILFFGIFNNI
ncbi:MAG: hypothetical protein JSS78_01065 [Bacteroidetes bacterium]|nr:hypothetical protein [Bacteroidota bacterium]